MLGRQTKKQFALLAIGVLSGILLTFRWGRVAVLFAGVCIGVVVAYKSDHQLVAILLAAFAVRIAIIAVDFNLGFVKHPPISPGHNQRAIAVLDGWARGQFFVELPGKSGDMRRLIATLIAPFYAVFGKWPVAGRLAVASYSLGLGVAIYSISRRVASANIALGTALVTLFWPSILYRSVVIQREVLLAILMLCFLYIAVVLAQRKWPVELLLLPILMWFLDILRPDNIFIVAAIFPAALFVRKGWTWRRFGMTILLSIPVVGWVIVHFGRITGFGQIITPRAINSFAHARAKGSTAYLVDLQYETWLDIALYLPIKVIYYLFMPFPWEWTNLQTFLLGINAMLLFVAVVLAVRGIGFGWRRNKVLLIPATFLIVGITAYAIIEMNYGAAFRRRIQFTPVILMFTAIRLAYFDLDVSGVFDEELDPPSGETTETGGG